MKKIVPDPPLSPTCARTFGECTTGHPPLFSVNPDIDPHSALVHASMYLRCAYDSVQESAVSDTAGKHYAWLGMHAIEAAKGLVDAVLEGTERAEWSQSAG